MKMRRNKRLIYLKDIVVEVYESPLDTEKYLISLKSVHDNKEKECPNIEPMKPGIF